MMRTFLDVGGHYGETLDVALDPRWGFDLVYSFEPAAACLRVLRGFRDPRLRVVPEGLSDTTRTASLFGAGLLGASIYADKPQPRPDATPEAIRLIRATDWVLMNTSAEDVVYLKLNCEGSECDVLEDLLASGAISRIRGIYVDFDVRKIPSQAHRQQEVERRLRAQGVDFATPGSLGQAGNRAVRAWLNAACPAAGSSAGQLRYRLGLHRPAYVRMTSVARMVLPKPVFSRAAERFGAQARRRG